ncbi:MAG: ATP-binding protein [Myxococcota bacterium]
MVERTDAVPSQDLSHGERDALTAAIERADLFKRAVEASPIGTMCVSAKTGRYAFINQAFADLIGRSCEELMSADPYQIWITATHADDLPVEREALERIGAGEITSYRLDKRMLRGGEAHWVNVELTGVRDPEGRLSFIIAHFREIEEQRGALAARERLEARLRQAEKLGSLGKLAGGVAHDFNNRLVIIMGYTELMKRALPADSPLLAHADMVLASAERASELTRQLLAYSQRQVLSPQSFDLNETVERMRRLLERLIGDDIEFSSDLRATHPIYSDPGQIEQVIMNLVINARDAMPDGGRLTLASEDVGLPQGNRSLPAGDYIVLSVRDTGTGIASDVLPHIFEPFFTTKEIGKGSGLGLATVEGIVNQSGGCVEVESSLGAGTTFRVFLPRAKRAPEPRRYEVESAAPSSVAFETVLVCDDDDGVRQLIADVLALRAYHVLTAKDGRDAIELARQHRGRIDLLVSDVVMPGMSGVDLAKALRELDPCLRVLFVSGYSDDPTQLSNPLAAHTHFLSKPFSPGELTQAVCRILESAPR